MVKAGIDWGSSGFRAYRFNQDSAVVETVESAAGIKFIDNRNFESTLFDQVGHWLQPGDMVVLSGMITSRNGWVETPYLDCPVNLLQLSASAARITVREIECLFLPGASQSRPADVMRGEELQLLGMASTENEYLAIIPGTHSKWVCVNQRSIKGFRTIATGELFAMLCNHSLIGALCDNTKWNNTAFLQAVQSGFNSNTIISDLFCCRSGVLLEQISATDAYAHLSGLLIGNEIREGLQLTTAAINRYVLIGDQTLCEKYQSALAHLGFNATVEEPQAAARGFQQLILSMNTS